MPGQPDVWNLVTFLSSLHRAATRTRTPLTAQFTPHDTPGARPESADAASAARSGTSPARPGRTRSLRIAALATTLVVLATGSVAAAGAHKSVTLDIDGELIEASTFAGSIGGLLAAHDVEVGERDLVAPGPQDELRDGDEVVVRHARQITVLTDGAEATVWTTALSADEALSDLTVRGGDVRLLASRSAATGRADLTVRLGGPVDVLVDGRTEHVADSSAGLDRVLADLDLTIGELDRVHVRQAESGLQVVVQRVVAQEATALSEVPFEQVTEPAEDLYKGRTRTAVAGVVGERAMVYRLILVDGVEESRVLLSDTVTRAPVTQVVREGTRPRPVVPAPAAGGGAVVTGDVWGALAQCESGGNPSAVSASGTYHGLYQFSVGTWEAMGGSGLPSQAPAAEQTQRAQALQARSGWGQWPACAASLGLL